MGVRGNGLRKEQRGDKARLIIDFRYKDKDGRTKRYRREASVQTVTAARAETERLKALAAATGTIEPPAAAPTLAAFVTATFTPLFMPRYRMATRLRYEGILRQGLLDVLGAHPIDQIGAKEVRTYAATLAARGVHQRGPVNLVRTLLRAAVEVGVLEEMPKFPKLGGQGRKLPEAPTDEEVATLLRHATGWLKLAVAIAALAGLRMGEVRALEVRDVDLARRRLVVRRALSEHQLVTPKSGHERMVPLSPTLQELLTEAVRGKDRTARIVVNRKGRTPTRQAVLTAFKELLGRLALPERSFHQLRHYFCTALMRGGGSVEAVRVLAGHHNVSVTARYLHVASGELDAAVARLPL